MSLRNIMALGYYDTVAFDGSDQPQNLASSSVQLIVGMNITLLLSVSRQPSSNTHTFMARLVNSSNRTGVYNRILTLQLDQTNKYTNRTDINGNVTWTIPLAPQANNTATIYNIVVSFSGDLNKSTTAYLYNPYGTLYAVSTTIQYNIGTAPGYTPSANSTSILIYPQRTTGATTLMNQEQMRKKQRTMDS